MSSLYDRIGVGYRAQRRADLRIAAAIDAALGDARTVLNVGAGTGSYEPSDRRVVAIEPSRMMIAQRPSGGAPAVRALAAALPVRDGAFDASLAILTLHHWQEQARALAELARVSTRRVVILTWLPDACRFWLVDDYFPDIFDADRPLFPSFDVLAAALGPLTVQALPIPHDCTDGFLGAYWRRPRAYLDAAVRAGMSIFARITDIERRLELLRRDLDDGTWRQRHGALLEADELDLGYRLVVADVRTSRDRVIA